MLNLYLSQKGSFFIEGLPEIWKKNFRYDFFQVALGYLLRLDLKTF